jgi:hypothetical protein
VTKRRGEAHRLLWKEDVDFVRLAARCRAVIVPFAAVGADDAFDLWMDTDEILRHPLLGPLASAFSYSFNSAEMLPSETVMPITTIPGTPLPSPFPLSNLGRVYFKFGTAIDTVTLDTADASACTRMYAECKRSVEAEIAELLAIRERDPIRGGFSRLAGQARVVWSAVSGAGKRSA